MIEIVIVGDIAQDLVTATERGPVPDPHIRVEEGAEDQDLRTSDEEDPGPVPDPHVDIGTTDVALVADHARRTTEGEKEDDREREIETEIETETETETERGTGRERVAEIAADHQGENLYPPVQSVHLPRNQSE